MNHSNARSRSTAIYDRCRLCADSCAESVRRNQKLLLFCILVTFAWGLAAHAYGFFHNCFSHDSLVEFNADVFGTVWKIQRGRVFVPVYRFLTRGSITLPWLIGVLALLHISFAVFWTVKLFDIRSTLLRVFVAGIFATNITVIATAATYIHDFDCNMLALSLAALSVYLWKRYDKGFLYGMLPLCFSIGLYQSYISVAITLMILYLVMRLLDGELFGNVFRQGLKSIAMLLGGGALYFIAMKLICKISEIAIVSGDYNSIDTALSLSVSEILSLVGKGYMHTCSELLTVPSVYPLKMNAVIHAVIIGITGLLILYGIFRKEIKIKEKLLTLVLIGLLPLSMNIVYAPSGGVSHDLMEFGFWLVYLFVLLVAWWAVGHFREMHPLLKYGQRLVVACLVFFVLWGNVQISNTAHLKKDLERQANLSLFTRVLYRMESYDGYVPGETPVVFVGSPSALDTIAGFEHVRGITGCWNSYLPNATLYGRFTIYFDDILLNPAVMAERAVWDRMQNDSRVAQLPDYPAEGCIAIIDDILVVKLGA